MKERIGLTLGFGAMHWVVNHNVLGRWVMYLADILVLDDNHDGFSVGAMHWADTLIF